MIKIALDDLSGIEIANFLQQHIDDMRATSPPESKHALDLDGLRQSDIRFWTATIENRIVGCMALKVHSPTMSEIKSMRTANHVRGQGVGSALMTFLVSTAQQEGIKSLYLETGSMAFFEPARRLYLKFGFKPCGPFANYKLDPNSVFMTKSL